MSTLDDIKNRLETVQPPMVASATWGRCERCDGTGKAWPNDWCGVCSGQGVRNFEIPSRDFIQAQDDIRWLIAELEKTTFALRDVSELCDTLGNQLAHEILYDEDDYELIVKYEAPQDDYDPEDDFNPDYDVCPNCGEWYCDKPACAWEMKLHWEHERQWKAIQWVKDGNDPLTYDARAEIEAEDQIPF